MESEKLFVYGTLMDHEVQRQVLRRIPGDLELDILAGFRKSAIIIHGEAYPIAIPDPKGVIEGYIFSVTPAELTQLDRYETDAYRREKVTLGSGIQAWAFIK